MVTNAYFGLVDSHCHLNFDVFDQDRAEVIERSRANGITHILIPAVDIETSRSAIKLSEEFSEVHAAVGIHPNSADAWTSTAINELRALATEAKVVAIGEIGLDYYRERTHQELQRKIFLEQLELAAELQLPVVIHTRNATVDMLEILHKWCKSLKATSSGLTSRPGVLHSFSGDSSFAAAVLSMNFKLGVNGPVTFTNAQPLQTLIREIPVESLLLETDAPFLTPHPFRGQRNEPGNVKIVGEQVAALKGQAFEAIAQVTTAQADMLFRWREIH